MNFLSADVPDPTDFPPSSVAPGLRTLDSSFRCDICGELYDAPVTVACGHCFCSTCIRTSLSSKHECPSCRKATDEAHIRPNPALESVISSWKAARPFILKIIKRDEEYRSLELQESDKAAARKRKRIESPSRNSSPTGNVPGPSRPPVSERVHKPPSKLKKEKAKSNHTPVSNVIPSSDGEEVELSVPSSNNAPKEDELVSCPICHKNVIYHNLNTHIDNGCKDTDTAAKSWSILMGGGAEKSGRHKGKHKKKESDSDDEYPLPLTTYTTLKDKQLKDMLSQHDLPTSGDRSIWEQRHRRWVTLFNANLDKSISNRQTKADLRRDLKKWETEELHSKKKKKIINDVKKYQIEQKSEFDRLIDVARPKKQPLPGKDIRNTATSSFPSEQTPPLPTSSLTEPGDTIVVDSEDD